MVARNKVIATLSKLSLGIVLILIWAFMWLRADILFPVLTEEWRFIILTYMLFVAFIFSFDTARGSRTESDLFKVSFLREFPKYIIAAAISIAVLFVFGFLVQGTALNSIGEAIMIIGFGVLILQAFMTSIFEELIFRGWVVEQLRVRGMRITLVILLQALVFAGFHAGLGKSLFTMVLYFPLGIIFYFIKVRFSPKTNLANAGAHFAYNLFILGILN